MAHRTYGRVNITSMGSIRREAGVRKGAGDHGRIEKRPFIVSSWGTPTGLLLERFAAAKGMECAVGVDAAWWIVWVLWILGSGQCQ